MKAEDLKNKSTQELKAILEEVRTKAAQLSFDLANRKLKDTSQIKKNKQDIARILTQMKILGEDASAGNKNG